MNKIYIGSRESKLAIVQSQLVIDEIHKNHPELEIQLVTIKTTGDMILDRSLDKIGGKGLFVKELDRALLDGRITLSVHSLKDMPMEIQKQLPIIAYSKREDARDALVLPLGQTQLNLDLPVGCSSRRRMIQLKKLYPEIKFKNIRGNVITRINKLDNGEYGGLVLASAGLKRLNLESRIKRYFEINEIIPAAGQGILAVQGKIGIDYSFLNSFNNSDSEKIAVCERAFVRQLNGGCSSPIAAHATISGDRIKLTGFYYNENTDKYIIDTMESNIDYSKELGIKLANKLKETNKITI